ncbi:exported hypothetical protein [uncultured Stenotrophomonas sp.]|uniref:Uncharacterized protein n=1 Tax=uncultured Stenotrophomonas sp. TaxID=165438 RepID=A0A1Y5Q3T1_9GAMM|nr:exported hypothetical protein [uncultured Stenotrophomonas sp.]
MNRNRKPHAPPPRRQRGVATLLIVLVVGLAVSVTVAATVYSLRGTQSRQLTTHSATAAQAAAWRGVEALRLYLLQLNGAELEALQGPVQGMGALGVRSAAIVGVAPHGVDRYRVNATVTGEAGVGSALTTATVEVVYDVGPGAGGPGVPPVCASLPPAPMVFNGNLDYSGGKLDVTNSTTYENIVVAGNLTVGGGSSARISGCMKGDVKLGGGGITDNGHIYSEGSIRIDGMGNPSGTTLWGRNVDIGNGVSGGNYVAVKAGAYVVTVHSGDRAIGTSEVGGRLIASTVTGGIPWTTGTVLPAASGRVVVTLADGSQFLLDMGKVAIDDATGAVSGAAAAAELLAGEEDSQLPDALEFRSTAITGGNAGLFTLTIGQLWGHRVSVKGWSGKYDTLWGNGDIDIVSGTIGSLLGGSNLDVNNVSVAGSGRVAGALNKPVANVLAGQVGTSPGLPGLPYCDARVKPIDADNYKGMANYIFESVGGQPQLTIQHVRRADGSSIDGVYPLKNPSAGQLQVLQELMTCNHTNDKGCLNVRQNDGSWLLHGVNKMPAGVLWFDAKLTVDGTSTNLLNTLVNRGDIALTGSGHGDLVAPNFAGAAAVCGGAFYPANLCADHDSFVTWENPNDLDDEGNPRVYTGLPIANTAVVSEEDATMAGWTIKGSVLLGKKLFTNGATVTIQGSLTVGSNERSDTTISAGGIAVDVPDGDGSLNVVPVCSAGNPAIPAGPATASVLWSRYL